VNNIFVDKPIPMIMKAQLVFREKLSIKLGLGRVEYSKFISGDLKYRHVN
jgi:hypothetical protein